MHKRVAAIVTEYRRNSHADMIVGRILEGFNYDGKEKPGLQLVSLYVDQFPANDTSRALAQRFGFPIVRSIDAALTLGRNDLAVDGVLCIGEHGKYPTNSRGQILYPRRRFFEEVCAVFARLKKSVPVFSDKHLAASWEDARWMYDRARELHVPFMAGSSVPLMWRRPALTLPRNCDLVEAVQLGYGPAEGYGFHALEGLQCMAERRRGGETGVRAVQYLLGEEMWRTLDQGRWFRPLLDAAVKLVPVHAQEDYRPLMARNPEACVFLIEYRDGFRAAVPIMNGWMYEGPGGGFIFAGKLKNQDQLVATQFYQQLKAPMAHFSYQLKAIESMIRTGHAAYPVERTLLTTGMLDALMASRADRGRRLDTPHLAIRYQPADWPFATDPLPAEIQR